MFQEFVQKVNDPKFRKNIISNPNKYAKELGYTNENVEYQVAVCTKNTLYYVFDHNSYGIDLAKIDGGIGTFSNRPACVSTYSCFSR